MAVSLSMIGSKKISAGETKGYLSFEGVVGGGGHRFGSDAYFTKKCWYVNVHVRNLNFQGGSGLLHLKQTRVFLTGNIENRWYFS